MTAVRSSFSESMSNHAIVKKEIIQNLETPSECFPHNSQEWLDAGSRGRVGNYNDSLMDEDFVARSILNLPSLLSVDTSHSHTLLQQTLCHKDSRLLSLKIPQDQLQNPSNQTVHFWSLRLMYWAIHIHQHLPALPEAQARLSHQAQPSSCPSQMQAKGIGSFDFECPSGKFLVVSMGRLGLGAVMRLGTVNALVAGVASNRTVVFVNNSPVGPKFLQQPWLLASCPRRDLQCFYMPPTPCVLTQQELVNATILQRSESRLLFKMGTLSNHLQDERVLLLDLILRPQRTPGNFRSNLVNIVQRNIIDPLKQQFPQDPRLPLLEKATDIMLVPDETNTDGSYYYFGHNSKHSHALIFYSMRPNLQSAQSLKSIMKQVVPPDMDPNLALGLPIRASDKCLQESECLSFPQYMGMVNHTFAKYQNEMMQSQKQFDTMSNQNAGTIPTSIIVTSEAPRVREAQREYQNAGLGKDLPFSFRFVNNKFDLQQGTGNPARMSKKTENIKLDEVMLSTISSLQAQLHARYTIANCCSNFHLLLFDFLRDGCGAARDQVAMCMQDHEDPTYRLCCQWSKSEECLAKKNHAA